MNGDQNPGPQSLNEEDRRLRWHCRRGLLELDLLFGPFFDEVYLDLSEVDRATFRRLLAEEDPDLLQWFSRKNVPEDPALAAMVERILDRVQP